MKRLITITMFVALLPLELLAQDQAPAAAPAPSSNPPAQSEQPQTEPAAAPPVPGPASPTDQTKTPPPLANPPKQTPKPAKRKPGTKAPAAGHGKVVVRNGGVKDEPAQLAPGMTKEEERRNREVTTRLLATTDANLKSIAGHQLTPAQQSQLDEIRTYMRQSKEASDSGDLARAQTLANKAHLLADELRK